MSDLRSQSKIELPPERANYVRVFVRCNCGRVLWGSYERAMAKPALVACHGLATEITRAQYEEALS